MINIKERCSPHLREFDEKMDRLGKCYQYAYQAVDREDYQFLVHGYIKDPIHGRVIDHAWAEAGNTIYDPTLNKKYPKSVYEKLFAVEVVMRYSQKEMYFMAEKFQHYGPWHKIPQGKVRWWRV